LWWFALRDYYTLKKAACKGLFSVKMHIFLPQKHRNAANPEKSRFAAVFCAESG